MVAFILIRALPTLVSSCSTIHCSASGLNEWHAFTDFYHLVDFVLAACLLVKGGTHPRGKTTVDVPAIDGGYDALGSIFYKANTNCLTPVSNFAVARWCTADVFGGINKANVHLAWDAVGVPYVLPPPIPHFDPIPFKVGKFRTGTFTKQAASKGELHQYTMHIREGWTISCSTKGNNGDADLYVRFGLEVPSPNPPSTDDYACVSQEEDSNESCTTGPALSGGTIAYAGVFAYDSYTNLRVTCKEIRPRQPKAKKEGDN